MEPKERRNGQSGSLRALVCATVGVALVSIWPADGFGQVVINEIMPDPKGVHDTDGGEWFELYNAGSGAVDLAGWKIKDEEHDSYVIDSGGTTKIVAGGYLVLCANKEEYEKLGFPGSCDYDYDYDNFKLSNSTDEVVLVDASDAKQDSVVYEKYGNTPETFPFRSGRSMALISPDLDNSDADNWCLSAAVPGDTKDHGTPGAENACTDTGGGEIPAPVAFDAARPSPDSGAGPTALSCAIEFECYEGMLIRVAAGTISSPNQRFPDDPVAEMYFTATSSRAFREPGLPYPGIPIRPDIPVFDGNPELFELDPDRLGLDNVALAPGSTIRATGVLGFEHGGYELWPFELTVLSEAAVPRPVRARRVDEVTIGSLNLQRLSSSAEDYATRLDKLSRYIREVLLSPDILGVQEARSIAELNELADLRSGPLTGAWTTARIRRRAGRHRGRFSGAFESSGCRPEAIRHG